MKLLCYAVHDFAPKVRAAQPQRHWMDRFIDRHAYRCLPLSIANAHGWEVLCPVPIEITWNGGEAITDLKVDARKPLPGGRLLDHFCRSHFSRGIVTFYVDYLFRTEAGWDLLATAPFNYPKDNAYPLTGIIEADWLPYPFSMNWQVLRPGRVLFEEDEPFCFIFPIRKQALLDCQPEIHRLSDDAELSRQNEAFRATRDQFLARLRADDPATLQEAWQRHYFLGRHPDGTRVDGHVNRLRLKEPVDRRTAAASPRPACEERSASEASPVRGELYGLMPTAWPLTPTLSPQTRAQGERASACRTDPRWHDDSALNEIKAAQTDANVGGRRRIDAAGELVDRTGTCVLRSQQDAAARDFLLIMDLLSVEECSALCQAFTALEDRSFRCEQTDPDRNNRFIWFADVAASQPAAGAIMRRAHDIGKMRISEFYRLRAPIFADLLRIVRWQADMFMAPHADNANPDHSEHYMAHRDFSGVFYLNDDYEGGEYYFTVLDIAVKPLRGMFLGFTCGFHHEHAVLRVRAGTRLTMPLFFTFDASKADLSMANS